MSRLVRNMSRLCGRERGKLHEAGKAGGGLTAGRQWHHRHAFKPLAAAVRGTDVLLFNATAPEDSLRREVCAREIVHTIPSLAMSMDGLTQYLVSRKWRDYLVLQGPAPADAVTVKAFGNSVKKYGARIVAKKDFKPGTDPRDREKNNPALLTAGTREYDALFIADDA